ncbi:uncharacterized protein LOC109703621 isoform X2 [Ananas comosus]|uniref:Uncharacterized protein LOC109703621 isoform X2 n=1 Tax=Ananas comosus TaxID=4615 RepID=A0A6P5EE11_ANACO|nr:uncharacterized protein LOC109703621 isoform X2 [Ananas comosus]
MLRTKLASLVLAKSSSSPTPLGFFELHQSLRYFSSTSEQARVSSNRTRYLGRRVLQIGLISLAGGFALSAINDLAIFHGCSSKAIEKASQNQKIVEAIGVPIARGPWYDASLAVAHRRKSVSCTFPVSGPQGSGIFQLKAIRSGEDGLFSFLRHHDWEILIMEALLHVPSNDEKQHSTSKSHGRSPYSHRSTQLRCLPTSRIGISGKMKFSSFFVGCLLRRLPGA